MNKSDIERMLERKSVDFSIPRNLLIKEVEDNFIKARKFRIYWTLTTSEYDENFNVLLKLWKLQNNTLNDWDALMMAEIIYLNWKGPFEKMIIDFYLENLNKVEEICEMVFIDKAKPEINQLTTKIENWLDEYLNKVAKENYTDLTWVLEDKKEPIEK